MANVERLDHADTAAEAPHHRDLDGAGEPGERRERDGEGVHWPRLGDVTGIGLPPDGSRAGGNSMRRSA